MSAAPLIPVRTPHWTLTYAGANISADVSPMVLSITYTDHLGDASGEIEVMLDDSSRKWQGPWFPAQGDVASLAIGYAGEALLPCGDFQVDEIELRGAPDVIHLRCLATGITPAMRTKNSRGYESISVSALAEALASIYGLTVVGAPAALNAVYERISQKEETDLGFLQRLAREHNYDFTVRGKHLVFFPRTPLEAQPPAFSVSRADAMNFEFKTRARQIYKAATVSYHNPATKSLITRAVSAISPTGDTLKIVERVENGQQAAIRAQAALHQANRLMVTGKLTIEGSSRAAAGINAAIAGFGKFDGTYLIESARHQLSRREGYVTEIDVRKVS